VRVSANDDSNNCKGEPKVKSRLAPLLNLEILRVANEERTTGEVEMKAFMTELADLCGVSVRQLYHYRSGAHPLPAEIVSLLCKRFGSPALLDELADYSESQVEIPDNYDLALLASRAVSEDMNFITKILEDFQNGGVVPAEMTTLRELAARAGRYFHVLMRIAEADCASRTATDAPPRKGSAKAEVRSQRTEVRETGTR